MKRSAWWMLWVSSAGCAAGAAPDELELGRADEPIIYGADDRVDFYEVEDPALRERAQSSIAALIPKNHLHRPPSGAVHINSETLEESYGVCPGERFFDQPTAGVCSGVLVDRDLLFTAGHCFDETDSCDNVAIVFDYLYRAPLALETLSAGDVYGCRRVLAQIVSPESSATQLDYAVVQLDRPATGRTGVPLRSTALQLDEQTVVLGFPSGLPLKIDRGGIVRDLRTPRLDYFELDSDTFGGNSGSGVFDASYRLIGLLVRGGEDYVETVQGCLVPNVVEGTPYNGWEQATYVQRAVKALCDLGYPSQTLCGLSARCGDGFCSADAADVGCTADCGGAQCALTGCGKGAGGLSVARPDPVDVEDAGADEPDAGSVADAGTDTGVDDEDDADDEEPKKYRPKSSGCALHSPTSPRGGFVGWLLVGAALALARARRRAA